MRIRRFIRTHLEAVIMSVCFVIGLVFHEQILAFFGHN
jgi:hypothetical protein